MAKFFRVLMIERRNLDMKERDLLVTNSINGGTTMFKEAQTYLSLYI